jgi:hypothetical protein
VKWKLRSDPAAEPLLIDRSSLSFATNLVRIDIVYSYNSRIFSRNKLISFSLRYYNAWNSMSFEDW